jgi:S1-C subfamily serine protease
MYKTSTQGIHRAGYLRLLKVMLILGFVCLSIIGASISTAMTTYAAGRPGGNVTDPVVRAVDIAEPAVVRIFTTVGGHLTVHFSSTNSVTFPQSGSSYQLVLSGSGTFITAHGDILTADHVVNPPRDQSLEQFLNQEASSDVAAYINQNSKPGSSQVTPSQIEQALDNGQLPSNPKYDPATSEVYLSTSYTGPLSATDFQSLPSNIHAPVDRIEMESSVNETDVAIVHVGMNDTPSVQLGDSTNVQQQDALTIIGFPGNGDVSNKPTDILTSSINKINVSSIKTTDSGAEVIQVGGNVEHGDSGGPGLDDTGAVVGIVSFGLSTPDSPGGTSFLQASNSARALVQSLHLDTSPGTFEKAWDQAFSDYAASTQGHWHKAQQELEKIATSYPLFKAVGPYLSYTQAQAKNESVPNSSHPTSSSNSNQVSAYLWTIGAIAIVVLLVFLLFGVFFLRRRKKSPAASAPAPAIGQASQAPPSPAAISQQRSGPAEAVKQRVQASSYDDGMTAFGAPPATISSTQSTLAPGQSVISGTLRPWPCGHMNRPSARYCSICGEPAPPPPTSRRIEQ